MTADEQQRLRYGGGRIREHADWTRRFPLGPVHWDVWNFAGELLALAVPANQLQSFMVSKKLLVLW